MKCEFNVEMEIIVIVLTFWVYFVSVLILFLVIVKITMSKTFFKFLGGKKFVLSLQS